ncbi:MAG: S-layer homology domain-containing protein [Oscillospiraceae bacterium]|nr:S-layer homology domain-containing protein [Oscillospiraceae bacterium]
MRKKHRLLAWALLLSMVIGLMPSLPATVRAANDGGSVVLNAMDYGADPTGAVDSTRAIQAALEAAREYEAAGKAVTLRFPRGEYHIYKDHALTREYHTSNTNSIENPIKTIGLLIEEHKNLTVDGCGSLFMMHGNMMALAVVKSENITLKDFAWDFAVPTVTELTVTASGANYTEFYIPECFPYRISGNTLVWSSDLSPYTGKPYWTATGNHNTYAVIAYHPDDEMARNFGTDVSPFTNATSITDVGNNVIRISYSWKNGTQSEHHKPGTVFALCGNAHRETAGAFTWESKNVLAEGVNVHFMHGFGWLIQMSEDVTYRNCNLMPRENSGHMTVSFADGLHASGAKGEIVIENCNFSNTHDDPINFHGTFTRVERRIDDHTLQLKYIHNQQGGFPQFHMGDQVAFFTRDTLESSDSETLYTVSEVVSEPGESGNDLRTMVVRFAETLPAFLTATVSNGTPKYVAENVTYAPAVTIKNSTFKNVPTRGILCTTRQPVLIEGNTFQNMSMATIFLSNDSNDWYESGPIRDMTIRNNTFYIKTIGDTYWDYKSAIYIHPVTYGGGLPSADNPIHKNITIEGNTFHMSDDTVVKAESVENLIIRDNTIVRTDPEFTIELSGPDTISVGETVRLSTAAEGTAIIGDNNKNLNDTSSRQYDNVFEFTACKNVVIEGNTYDDGMKNYAVIRNMPEGNLTNDDPDITVVTNASLPADDPVSDLVYVSSEPDVVSVDADGQVTALASGTAEVYAYYVWHDTITKSNSVTFTVAGGEVTEDTQVQIGQEGTLILTDDAPSATLTANTAVTWSAADFLTDSTTDVVTAAADGTVTAVKNGIAWIKASAGSSEDRIPVVVSLSRAEGLASGFSITREDASNYSLADAGVTITQQGGNDLWQWDNNLENLFLYGDFDRSDLRTLVKIENLPVRTANCWDTASFLLYAGDDDYVSIGKKAHKNGMATVVEQAQSCTEYEESSTANNNVTTAWFGFTVENGTISMDYKLDGGEWVTAKTNSAALLGDAYRIGFGAWGTGGNDITYSEFRVGKASETSYDELMAEEALPIGIVENQAPVVSDVVFDAERYEVGNKATVRYSFTDPDGDAEGTSLYLWTNGDHTAVTDVPEFTVLASGTLTCAVYPVDAAGTPGAPAEAAVSVTTGDPNLVLSNLEVNGTALALDGRTEFEVRIPVDLTKVELGYAALMDDVGTTAVQSQARENSDRFGLDITGQETITITRTNGQDSLVYTIRLIRIESNATDIRGIEIPELSLSETDLTAGTWLTRTTDRRATLKILADDTIGGVEVRYNNYRSPIAMTRTGEGFEGAIDFITGLNSYYITVVAKDGVTTEQYNVNVVYTPDTVSELKGLKINGVPVEDFAPDAYKYLVELPESDSVTVEADTDQSVRIRIGDDYILEDAGENTLTADNLKGGSNDVYIVTIADDGIVRQAYHVELLVPYEENVELFTFTVNGTDVLSEVDGNGTATIYVSNTAPEVQIVTKDAGASIRAVSGGDVTQGTGSVAHTVRMEGRTAGLEVTITARDGVTTAVYSITLIKVLDPNDSSRDIPIPVLTATAGDWQRGYEATEGPAELVLDNNPSTLWHTDWYGTSRANHWIQFELSEDYVVDGLRYLPRSGGSANGTITEYQILVSDDGVSFEPVAAGNWANNTNWKIAEFEGVQAKFVRLVAVDAVTDNSYVFASAAEIRLTGVKADAHEHSYTAVVTAPTCTEGGYTTYTCECGDSYIADETAPLGHTEQILPGKEATCTETGLTEGRKCAVCGEILVAQEEIPALGHDYSNGKCTRCDAVKTSSFVDVKAGDFFFDPVEWAVEKGITNGTDATHFSPNGNCMRGHVVTFLWRAMGSPEPETSVNPFVDVKESDYFYKAVLWAYEKGITTGIDAIHFAPTGNCNRAQVVTFLWRAMGKPDSNAEVTFTDVKTGEFYTTAVAWAVENNITNGMGDGTFGVNGTCNRAQVVTFLYRALNK